MDDLFIRRLFASVFCGIVAVFALAFVKIILSDGNSALVTNVTNNFAGVIISAIIAIAVALLGQNAATIFGNRPGSITTISTPVAPQVTTAQTTIVQQKANEDSTP